MFPKIKKKIKSFINDERGTISKKNLITGALILAGIGSLAKSSKADTVPGDGNAQQFPTVDDGSWRCDDPTRRNLNPYNGYLEKRYCDVAISHCSWPKSHKNTAQLHHYNTNKNFHRNNPMLSYEKTAGKVLKSTHNHHGQHANADVIFSEGGQSHCSY